MRMCMFVSEFDEFWYAIQVCYKDERLSLCYCYSRSTQILFFQKCYLKAGNNTSPLSLRMPAFIIILLKINQVSLWQAVRDELISCYQLFYSVKTQHVPHRLLCFVCLVWMKSKHIYCVQLWLTVFSTQYNVTIHL